jgi:pimeloyl-ACP methyl ester carboxylesterase
LATFVLVHGAWMGGWCYSKTARLMRAAGHEVHVVTLTGLGDRAHLSHPGITLSTHIQDVVSVFEYEDITDAVLVGHSYGGMPIAGASGRIAGRIRTIVYLDAFLPTDGQALWDIASDTSFYIERQKATPGLVAPPGRHSPEGPDFAKMKQKKLDLHPLLTLTEPVRLDGSEKAIARRVYILATQPPIFQRFYDQVKDDPAWTTKTIEAGHVMMQENPELLAKVLLEEA